MSPDKLLVRMHGIPAGILVRGGRTFTFSYLDTYEGPSVSLAMPIREDPYVYAGLPPFFDGLLPEGVGLEGLLRTQKLDRTDWMGQLLAVGQDVPGAVTLEELPVETE